MDDASPFDERTTRLLKLALAVGAEADGAVRSDVRKCLAQGVTGTELRAVALLAITTCSFPSAIAGLRWVDEVLARETAGEYARLDQQRVVLVRDVLMRRCPGSGAAQFDADLECHFAVADGECLGLATRQKPRIEPAVMAHGDRPASQVHDLHHVRVTVLRAETVLVVASVRGSRRAGGHFGDSGHRLLLHRRPRPVALLAAALAAVWTAVSLFIH